MERRRVVKVRVHGRPSVLSLIVRAGAGWDFLLDRCAAKLRFEPASVAKVVIANAAPDQAAADVRAAGTDCLSHGDSLCILLVESTGDAVCEDDADEGEGLGETSAQEAAALAPPALAPPSLLLYSYRSLPSSQLS